MSQNLKTIVKLFIFITIIGIVSIVAADKLSQLSTKHSNVNISENIHDVQVIQSLDKKNEAFDQTAFLVRTLGAILLFMLCIIALLKKKRVGHLMIRDILILIFFFFSTLMISSAYFLIVLLENDMQHRGSDERELKSIGLAYELKLSSDNLTRFARTYVMTGEQRYMDYYNAIIAIREGRQAHPREFTPSYWDHVAANMIDINHEGELYSIEQRMIELGFTESEKNKFFEAKQKSDDLCKIENKAMNAAMGIFQDENGHYTRKGEPNLKMANQLLYGKAYLRAKCIIMTPIDQFFFMIEKRIDNEEKDLIYRNQTIVKAILVLIGFTIAFSIFAFYLLKRRIIDPLTILESAASSIQKRNYNYQISLQIKDEMGSLADALDAMTTSIKKHGSELEKLWRAVEASPSTIIITDKKGYIEYVNPKLTEVTGYTMEEIIGKKPDLLNAGKQPQEHYDNLWRTISQGQEWHGEFQNKKKNGTLYWENASISPIKNSQNEITHFVMVSEDITERKMIEEELKRSEANLAKAQQLAQVGSWELDIATHELRWSTEVYRIFEINPEHFGASYEFFINIIHPDDREAVNNAYTNSLETKQAYQIDHRLLMEDGRVKYVNERCETFYDESGNPLNSIGTIQDVTDIKRAEMALSQAKEAAESATRAKTEFLANMSHEIRTPLNAIIGFSDLLSSLITDTNQKSYLDAILVAGKSLLNIINDILDLSKIEAGKLTVINEPTQLHQIFEEIHQVFKAKLQEKKLAFILNIDDELPHAMWLDEVRIRQVLLNIVGNAVKFTESGSITITVQTLIHKTDQNLINLFILVEDTGIGIPDNQKELIFKSFKQQDGQSNKKYGGTGLGLSISKRLIEMMNGQISVSSKPGKGSLFIIQLNDIKIFMKKIDNQSLEKETNLNTIRFKSAKVLIVDDIETNRIWVKETLKLAGLEIAEAENGEQALQLIKSFSPDLVIMDIIMPVMDGYTANQHIKSNPATSHIPVIALTASTYEKKYEQEIKNNFDGFLFKPVNINDLFRELSLHLKTYERQEFTTENESTDWNKQSDPVPELKNLPELRHTIESEIVSKIDQLKKVVEIDLIEDFANELIELSKKHNAVLLKKYAEDLLTFAQSIDIEQINLALGKFSILYKNLIQ